MSSLPAHAHPPKGGAEAGEPLARAAEAPTPRGEGALGLELDPLALTLAEPGIGAPLVACSPGAALVAAPAAPAPGPASASSVAVSVLAEDVVRRVLWGGDKRRGTACIELGGILSGTLITVEGEGREVSVGIALPPGAELGELPARLRQRLARRGVVLRSLEVR